MEMKSLKDILYYVALLSCLVMGSVMTYFQFVYFMRNEDVSSISFRKFATGKEDHPTYTICFLDINRQGDIFTNDIDAWPSFDSHVPIGYIKMRYKEHLLGTDYGNNNDRDINLTIRKTIYDNVAVSPFAKNIIDFVSIQSNATYADIYNSYAMGDSTYWTLALSHQDAYQRCYTKEISDNTYFVKDKFDLKGWNLNEFGLSIALYIHEEGQMYRTITKNKTTKIFHPPFNGSTYEYIISEIEVLRRRGNSKLPCNETIANEDDYFREVLIQKVGCVPDYWKTFISNTSLSTSLSPKCNYTQYKMLSQILNTPMEKNELYLYPCLHMKTRIEQPSKETIRLDGGLSPSFVLILNYRTQYELYKEITNHREFTLETLFGQVGGFVGTVLFISNKLQIFSRNNKVSVTEYLTLIILYVGSGIFLGYSILQVFQYLMDISWKIKTSLAEGNMVSRKTSQKINLVSKTLYKV